MLLNQLQLAGFRLHPGPLPEQYRSLLNQVHTKEKKKHKKKKHRGAETPAHEDGKTDEERKERKKHKKKDHDSEVCPVNFFFFKYIDNIFRGQVVKRKRKKRKRSVLKRKRTFNFSCQLIWKCLAIRFIIIFK